MGSVLHKDETDATIVIFCVSDCLTHIMGSIVPMHSERFLILEVRYSALVSVIDYCYRHVYLTHGVNSTLGSGGTLYS